MRSIVLLCSGLLVLSSCRDRTRDDAAAVTVTAATPGVVAERGGALALAANLRAEVLAQPDGHVLAYLSSPQGVPIQASSVKVGLRKPDGQVQAVPVTYDPAARAYVGRAAGVPPGAYPVQLAVQQTPTSPLVQMVTAPVTLASTVQPPAPQHGGRVMVLGDKAVEVVVARSGDVAAFWTTLAGAPIDPGQVVAPALVVKVDDRPQTVALRPSGGALVGHLDVGAHAELDVSLPGVSIGGAVYFGAEAPRVVVVPSIPGNLFAAPTAPTVVIAQHAPVPAMPPVVIARPAQPPPTVVFVQQGGEGRGRNGRGHGDDDDNNDDDDDRGRNDRGRGHGRGH